MTTALVRLKIPIVGAWRRDGFTNAPAWVWSTLTRSGDFEFIEEDRYYGCWIVEDYDSEAISYQILTDEQFKGMYEVVS